jgi:hypothetical protein
VSDDRQENENDGISILGLRDPAEPLGQDSEVIDQVVERRGDYPNTATGGPGGRTRTTLEKYAVDPADGAEPEADYGPLDDQARDELERHADESEQRNSVQSWPETGRSDLPEAGPQPRVEKA